ncbi:MAG TPA: amino acid adenylation domain-containing protein [Thermoanaerobaculia bacterium]
MLGHWRTLLEGIAADPSAPLSRLPLLTWPERQQVFSEWNDTGAAFPGGLCLHHLVAAQASRTPEALAVTGERERLTYRELMERAGGFARFLRGLGVGPETRVGFCLQRTPEMIAAMLGILQAGGAYLPLDPSYPRERLEVILTDGGAAVLLTESSLVDRLPAFSGPVVLLDQDRERIEAAPEPKGPAPEAGERNLAYIIYTSGSTGRPKGVAIEHRNAVTLVHWGLETYPREALQVSLAATSVCFDISVFEIFAPLAAGGRLLVVPNVLALRNLAASDLRIVNAVPSPMAELAGGPFPANLRVVNLGGEPLKPELVERIYAHPQVERVYNLYGPSEDTTYSTVLRVPRGVSAMTIGRPVANTQARVLGRHGELLPAGVPGELFLGGAGVSRGYLGRPEVTAERYVPDPYGPPGSRMYRTGDRVRVLPDGQLDYLGRLDYQVKLHGVRIELGEIEAVLEGYPLVRQAVAAVRTDDGADARLVAYVVPEGEGGDLPAELAAYLRGILPAAMVPTAWVVLPELPLSSNGKVDRRALPAPFRVAHAGVAPRNPMEESLTAIFREALGVEELGIHDDFFELGGHSLMAIRAAFRISEAFGAEVPVSALFQAPTVAEMAEWLGSAGRTAAEAPAIPAAPAGLYPLSFAQQGLWLIDRLQPGSALYNISIPLRLEGRLDVAPLGRALAEILRRHEPLRTVYDLLDGEPVQVVLPPPPKPFLPRLSLAGLPEPARRSELLAVLAMEERLAFDLERGPVARFLLIELGPQEHVLVATFHHIATDGWSMGVFSRELTAAYRAFAEGRPSPLPRLPLRYVDHALAQRRALADGTLARQLDYWRSQLAGIPVLELPADRPRPLQPGPRGGGHRIELPAGVAAALEAVRRAEGITPFMVLLAGFAAFLARTCGQDDFGIGVPSAGRNRAETQGMIGFFVNTLVLRPGMEGDPTFLELARRVRDTMVAAQAHQDVPFEKVVEELQPERAPGVSPLFQALFNFLNDPEISLSIPGLSVSLVEMAPALAKFDLTLSLHEWKGSLGGWLEYRTDLFEPSTAERMAGWLTTLLAGATAEPGLRLSELPLLTAAERRQLQEWSGEPVPAAGVCVHQLFEERARLAPDDPALIADDGTVSFASLDARANRLARHLLALGLAPEARVAVCLERSPELFAALLAILKAGGAYLPLDPDYPPERMRQIVEDAGAVLLVSREALASRLPAGPALVLLDRDAGEIAGRSAASPGVEVDPGALAYVIYTSGSTGRPKGVGVPHAAAAAHLQAVRREYGLGPGDRTLQFASPGFDVSVEQILATLTAGAALAVRDGIWSTHELTRRIRELGLTYVNLPTAYWHRWVSDPGDLETAALPVRLVLTGGEEMLAGSVRVWAGSPFAGIRLLNGYGPTEAVITATLHEVTPEDGEARTMPIGRPIPGRLCQVLDRSGYPQPAGIPGELALGGPLARGYLNRPALTAERFIPDAFSGQPGARLYRTGDRARFRPDGRLEFLGRIDEQVKLRGFRVEPAEVEALLAGHPEVREAVVTAFRTAGGDLALAAYVVPAGEGQATPASLRAFLGERLPDYMVPAAWTVLPSLPLNAHGKVDRRALPAPETAAAGGSGADAPVTLAGELLAGLFADLLGRERVGADESFFELGGHSLLATQLVSRVRAVFGVELPLAAVFERPTPAALAELLDAARRAPASPDGEPRLVREPGAAAPLSFAQRRLWFLHQLEPDDAYHVPGALRFRGPLREDVLERTLEEVVRRHEALRTVFGPGDGEPVQTVLPPAGPRLLPVADLSALPAAAREAEAARLLRLEADRAFDLSRGPLIRLLLLRLSSAERLLSLVVHHIVSDAWSTGVLLREMSVLYAAFAAGRPSPLPELPVQYPDFARWQRRWLSGERLEREVAHWRRALASAPESLELPYDRPPGAAAGTRGGCRPAELPAGLYGPLVALARREGWTAFMALFAGFQALLARYSGQTDVVVGSPIANRNRLELEGLIGFFTNTLALRADLAGDPAFREIGRRVRAAALDAYAHQDLPFEKLVEELSPDRQAGRNPIFQTVLVLQSPPAAPALPGIETGLVEVATGAAKFDLTLLLTEDGSGASGVLEYARDLFDGTTAERLLGHLRNLLAGAVEDPGRRLSELPLLTAHERQQVFDEWNDTLMTRAPEGRCLHHLVAAQARRTPDAVAVVGERETLTYRGLTERAGRLARFLRGLGVGPETRVGLCVERTPDMVAAMLGILEAGGAYLPLDPAYPRERVELMLADGGAPVLVTESALAGGLPSFAGPVVLLDADRQRIDAAVALPGAAPEVDETNLAYVIFTSGSTGRPKGVAIEHHNAVTLVGWGLETFPPEALEASLVATSICFDISVFEIFAPLAVGGRLIVVPNVLALPGLAEEVTIVNAVPSPMAEVAGGPFPARLRVVNLGGEPLKPDLVDRIYSHPQVERVYNLYGPSEDTTYSTFLRVPRGASRITVGRPVAETQARVLGRSGELLPAGVAGELFLSGGGLSRGYLGRPDLTAERFVPDPYGPPGARMYRTGDRIRLLPDGQLDFLGRFDHQVKIRGVRIELGEIEAALERHPAVRQAVAVVRSDGPLGARLVGYVMPEEGAGEDLPAELAAYLREILPAVMVPTVWMVLPAFPLSPNGKVDRRALPDPERSDSAGAGAPRTPAEERMAAIWSEVLGVAGVGADDDFFDLGGHSLLATQVASRVQEVFGVHLPLRRMFEASTLAAMTAAALGSTGADAPPPPIRRAPRDGGLPLSFAQERLWLIDRLQPGGSAYNIPLSLLAEGRLDVARLAAALSGLARRHEVLRTVFAERGGAPVQVVLPEADVPLPVVDLAGLPADRREPEARRLAAVEAARPFDLARGPLLRGLLIALAARRSWLLLSLHHIVADGWSMGVLVREIKALYAGGPLPELPVQYADFAVWQRGWLTGEVLEGQLAWWRERLRGVPSTLELPLDRPRPPLPSPRGGEHAFALDGELSRRLAELAHREGATPFMVLAAGLFALLSRLSGQSDLAVGSPIANRHHLETEGLIGFFVNTLVLRADLSRAGGFRDLLLQVRETTLGAYAHQDLPFEKLVDELQPQRDLTRSPFFQVVLALQNAPLPQADLGEARLLPQEIPMGVAKFDLTFLFAEADDGRLTCLLQYASDLFDPPTAVRYARHLGTLLADLVARPEGRLAAASLLTGEERQQILQEWNDTRREWEDDPALHQLFERQADLRPEAVAAICDGESVTYGELEARANRLAHRLRRLSVRRGEPVGLWMGRSLDLLAAVLGILKSGAVYVPLDAAWPAERVETILSDTGTRVLVAGRNLAADAPEHVVYLIDPTLAAAPAARPEPWAGPDDPAYLIHTSGSTGVPKGIIVRHRSAVNTLRWNNETLEIGPGDRHLFVNSISFDLSIYDMLGMLGAGATVRVAAEDELRDPERLAGILRHEGITTWSSAPAALQQLVSFFPPPGEGRSLRRVFLAGDWIPLSLPDLVRTAFPGAVIGNFGGATETSVWSNWFRVDEVDPSWTGIPYGRPLHNTRYYILDADLSPCPPGVPGDNHIGGGCLAFGYAGQPALTAERFIPDPFADEPGARMYATGDRARFRPDGTMEFLGRVDHQVKVRGYRIELGEIEAALARHPGVREAVALAREDVPGEKRLVAYVVPSGRPAPETEELREALSRTLPEYMVPWTYVFLDALPVTANGKLDRRALPVPGAAGAGEIEYVAPRNELEKTIAAAWREVLGVERVGVHDNFFETGGSSLLIVKLHARLKETLGLDVPVMELFRYTTVDSLARKLAEEEPAAQEAKSGEIRERAKTRQDALRQLRQARSERKPR